MSEDQSGAAGGAKSLSPRAISNVSKQLRAGILRKEA